MSRRPSPLLLLPLALLCTSAAWGQSVHKCADANGRISYSDMPCLSAPKAPAPKPVASATSTALPAPTSRPSTTAAVSPAVAAPIARPTANEADADLAARRDQAAQTADCTAALKRMGAAGGGMQLVEAGNARTTALARCNGG